MTTRTNQLASRPPARRPFRADAAWLVVLATACIPPVAPTANGNASAAVERRVTELVHEPCDLTAKDNVVLDVDANGKPEVIRVMEGGREVCRAVDINLDSVIDLFIYSDAAGNERRRESGFDRDTLPDEVSLFEAGVLVRKERETNNDRKIDTWDYYQNGVLVREERDASGDGFVSQWWTFNRPGEPGCAIVQSDTDGDGRPNPDSEVDLCADADAAPEKAKAKGEDKKSSDEPSDDGRDEPSGDGSDKPAATAEPAATAAPTAEPGLTDDAVKEGEP